MEKHPANGEFVVNLIGEKFGPLMKTLETNYPYEVNELEKSGFVSISAKEKGVYG
jgi:flavin reductase (DIM6/NTAB) family NADH-FMN oxidoreductase RutF